MAEDLVKAAALWGLKDAPAELAARRENVVYRVEAADGPLALRFHRVGYRSEAELQSEADWLAMLAEGGVPVPRPVASTAGRLIENVDGQHVDVLTWEAGAPLGKAGELKGVVDRLSFCSMLGAQMARLHDLSDAWERPAGFTRPSWDRAGLFGDAPLWGRFWEHPALSAAERDELLEVRAAADAALDEGADFGLIHADLLSENMLWDGETLTFIDFDDGGFGFRDFELATFLLRYRDAPDYAEMRAAVCAGYAARREVEDAALDLMILARALTYVGWIADRLDEPGAQERSERAIRTALGVARDWKGR